MNRETVKEWIYQFINKSFNIEINEQLSLLDPRNGLMPRDLLALFFEIEKEFSVSLEEKDILERRFDYVEEIVDAVVEGC